MLTTNYTVAGLKDIAADDFIEAYAKHLKTQGKFEIPKVCRVLLVSLYLFLSGLISSRLPLSRSSLLMMLTGFTPELLPSHAVYTSDPTSALVLSERSSVVPRDSVVDQTTSPWELERSIVTFSSNSPSLA